MGAAYSLYAITGVRAGPSRHAVVCALTAVLAGILLAALLGWVLGLAAQGNRTVWWRLPLAAVMPAAGMGSTHTIGTAVASATVPHAPPAAIGWAMVPVVALVSAGPFGLLFGLALAERLNAARRRAMDDSRTDGEAAS